MAKGKYEYWLTPEGLLKLEGWARDGLTDEQIAQNIGISRSTLNAWKERYSDISDTLKKGKEVVDRKVENALLKRALGYTYNAVSYTHLDVYKRQGLCRLFPMCRRAAGLNPGAAGEGTSVPGRFRKCTAATAAVRCAVFSANRKN